MCRDRALRTEVLAVSTRPRPKCICQMRFTKTRAVSGFFASNSQRARPIRFSGHWLFHGMMTLRPRGATCSS